MKCPICGAPTMQHVREAKIRLGLDVISVIINQHHQQRRVQGVQPQQIFS